MSCLISGRPLVSCLATVMVLMPSHDAIAQAGKQAPLSFEEAEAIYRAKLKRPSLSRRIDGRKILARSNDERAVKLLIKDYKKPRDPDVFIRALLVTLVADYYRGEKPIAAWHEWRMDYQKPADAWLWYHAIQAESENQPKLWQSIVTQRVPIELRMAALAAAAAHPEGADLDSEALDLINNLIGSLTSRKYERPLLLEGMAELFAGRSTPLNKQQKAVLRGLAQSMADRRTTERTKIVMARTFARALKRDNIGPDPASWIELLADQPDEKVEMAYALQRNAAKPGFFGITEHGQSIAYVIDASDSMLEPLTPRERQHLQPLTGKNAKKATGAGARGLQTEQRVDWSKVKTRFDGARELLKLALGDLGPKQRFTIILFGDEAEHLRSANRLVHATPKNVKAACAEIDAIVPGRAKANRPHGTLRGDTNLHGGMLLAFQTTTSKPKTSAHKKSKKRRNSKSPKPKRQKHLPAMLNEHGIDTIYLLSDGAPSGDNWDGVDTNDGSTVADPETGKRKEHTGSVIYPGPFTWPHLLVRDIERLNMMQHCAIHAVGLGEADYKLLDRITRVGHGTTVQIGRR